MPNSPFDEIIRNFLRILEESFEGENEPPRIIGCTIIASGTPTPVQRQIEYEMTESDSCVYITARVPSWHDAAVQFEPDSVILSIGDREDVIRLDSPIDTEQSTFTLNRGVLDAVCVKAA
ncbi:CS domain-containing protein [Methanofollis fontis]|uniref:CS domain-containing protein n=1 Tax=Methanofollis fontis TaxID=2052832 RepID=A0A483CWN4_9EURY|nr:CS domain-containing protein [Methanofollis fontis]TAJ43252.1 hypothetical protein CUJ86_11460 [Methanofollis fontis]